MQVSRGAADGAEQAGLDVGGGPGAARPGGAGASRPVPAQRPAPAHRVLGAARSTCSRPTASCGSRWPCRASRRDQVEVRHRGRRSRGGRRAHRCRAARCRRDPPAGDAAWLLRAPASGCRPGATSSAGASWLTAASPSPCASSAEPETRRWPDHTAIAELDLPADVLPLVPVRNLVLFPGTVLPVTMARPRSIARRPGRRARRAADRRRPAARGRGRGPGPARPAPRSAPRPTSCAT